MGGAARAVTACLKGENLIHGLSEHNFFDTLVHERTSCSIEHVRDPEGNHIMSTSNVKTSDAKLGLQGLLVLDVAVRLFIWSSSMALTVTLMTALNDWPEGGIVGAKLRLAWKWGETLTHAILLFNLIYVAHLVIIRLVVPTPKEGSYSMAPGAPLDRQLIWAALVAMLTKARYQAPFPGVFVFHIANLPPMRWFMNRVFGPKSKSCYVLDPIIGDPHLTEIGRNVVFGFNASVTCHTQQRDTISVKKVVIGDDVLVGANAVIFSGCEIGRGAVILSGAVVSPNTIVGEYEVWGGMPAKKIKDLPPYHLSENRDAGGADNTHDTHEAD